MTRIVRRAWERHAGMAAKRTAAVVCVTVIASVLASAPAHAATDCRDVIFLGVAGSGELYDANGKPRPNNNSTVWMGESVHYMAERMAEHVRRGGENITFVGVDYPAAGVTETLVPSKKELLAAGVISAATPFASKLVVNFMLGHEYKRRHLDPFMKSINTGIAKVKEKAKQIVSDCPDSDLVMAGYSQGAMSIKQAQIQLEREGDEDTLDAIIGTLLLADGDRTPDTGARILGWAPKGGEGIRPYLRQVEKRDVFDPETTVEICVPKDLVCDFNPNRFGWLGAISPAARAAALVKQFYDGAKLHTTYKNKNRKYLDEAVDWLAEDIGLFDEPAR